ncbi:MAG: hypothetical protein J5861_02065, partial [Desulfovibrio sp.]|nr:hypothetical protein [Desulfovibrio sp.]
MKIRILQLVVLLIIVGFLGVTLFSMRSLNSLISSNAQSLTSLLSANIYDSMRNLVSRPAIMARTISYDSFLRKILNVDAQYPEEYMAERLGAYLSEIRSGIDYSTAFIISHETRRVYGIDGTIRMLETLSDQKYELYDKFISSGKPRVSAIQKDTLYSGQETFFTFSRITDNDGKVIGVVGVGVPLDDILRSIDNFEQRYNVKIFFVDWDENVKISSGNATLDNLPASYRVNRDFNYVDDQEGGYVMTRYLDDIGWFLVIKGNSNDGRS